MGRRLDWSRPIHRLHGKAYENMNGDPSYQPLLSVHRGGVRVSRPTNEELHVQAEAVSKLLIPQHSAAPKAVKTLIGAINAARSQGTSLTEDASVYAAATQTLSVLRSTIDRRALNQEYKRYRLATTAAKLPVTPYPKWLRERELEILQKVALEIAEQSKITSANYTNHLST